MQLRLPIRAARADELPVFGIQQVGLHLGCSHGVPVGRSRELALPPTREQMDDRDQSVADRDPPPASPRHQCPRPVRGGHRNHKDAAEPAGQHFREHAKRRNSGERRHDREQRHQERAWDPEQPQEQPSGEQPDRRSGHAGKGHEEQPRHETVARVVSALGRGEQCHNRPPRDAHECDYCQRSPAVAPGAAGQAAELGGATGSRSHSWRRRLSLAAPLMSRSTVQRRLTHRLPASRLVVGP